ncbi:hypothetical protein PHLGIDRAFT_32363 [Phlebiopsis gigantea 11061_1 CR5-6]|uniref:Uncharacterized protein n=1 Tax=Phlebiopsis gigantea (strain 11061_1 CR5-6) TaxID=745531 RepID=A0A0C3RZN4_PHLG1|nr:hypothetical protein PHLGIDRAFT_32363 [Phlebiopsis gigantea 11061_1 CR5-6]
MPDTHQEAAVAVRNSCTCDACIDGWLAPRMKERLEVEANFLRYVSNSLLEDLSGLPADEVLPDWIIAADTALHYIPMELHTKMSPAFYRGYVMVIEAIYYILLQEPLDVACIPTPAAITARIQEAKEEPKESPTALGAEDIEDINKFFAAGGRVEFALEALTDRAMEKSPEGSEYRRKTELREEEEEFEKEVDDIPMCMNDLNFAFVRTRLGLPAHSIGPHWFFLTDSEEEDEFEGDDGEEVVYEVQTDRLDGTFMKRRE